MAELVTTDGKPVDTAALDPAAINAKFGAAMNDDGPDVQAPPPRQPRPAAPAAEAPARRRARAPKEDRARTTGQAAAPAVIKDDYSEDARDLVGGIWTVTASIPFTQPYALVIEGNSDSLAASLAEGAKHNATIRSWVSAGQSSWMIGLAGVGLTMGLQTYQLMRDPEMRAEAAKATRASLRKAMEAKGITMPEPAPDAAVAA